jgi:hypothetical protein
VVPPDNQEARLGVYFQYDELLKVIPASLSKTAVKTSRQDKWLKMVSYGLADDLVRKVVIKKNKTPYE